MGLFSHSVTSVGTQVQRVIEDAHIPNSVKNGNLQNIFDAEGGGDQMIEYVFDQMANSVGLRAGRMYNYGKNGYLFGLPQSTLHSSLAGEEASQAAIAASVGSAVTLAYYHFGPLNFMHEAWRLLQNQYGYDPVSNKIGELTASKGTDVFLTDMQLVLTPTTAAKASSSALDQWGPAPNGGIGLDNLNQFIGISAWTPYVVNAGATQDTVEVHYAWKENVPTVIEGISLTQTQRKTGSLTLLLTGFDLNKEYHQAKYTTVSGTIGYWSYLPGTHAYPAVDNVFEHAYATGGTFFPFGYLRYNKATVTAASNPGEHASSKKLLNYLNMDFDAVSTTINANPDIKDVEQAILMMAVPANTTNPLEQRYLFDFFGTIADNTVSYGNSDRLVEMMGIQLHLGTNLPQTSIVIQDARFKMALAFDQITKSLVPGKIGKVGSYASGMDSAGAGRYWYRKQVTDILCMEVSVTGLKMTFFIRDGYTTTGDENNQNILLIPIDVGMTENYSVPDRELLYSRALHYVFNSYVVTDLKWYQTGIFKALLTIAAIVITVISLYTAWVAIAAAAAISLTAALITILSIVLKYILVSLAIKLFVKVIGAKFALIAALVAALWAGYDIYDAGSLKGAPFAKDLLALSTNLSQGAQKQEKTDLQSLLGEANDFQVYVDKQLKTLQTAQDLLNSGGHVDPLLIFGESANDFYQRTVHSGNIGILGIDAISSYVDLALQLPTISQTLGETSYG